MNRENVQHVRDHIASLPDEQVNMGVVRAELSCGTVACIAGWAVQISGRHAPTLWAVTEVAQEWLDLHDGDAYELFAPENWQDDEAQPEDEKLYPKARVIATLDHLLATGEVDWNASEKRDA